jgi:hypothetical protein
VNDCKEHQCTKECGEPHSHSVCDELVSYSFPDCGHPAPNKKKCSTAVKWKCKTAVETRLPCSHLAKKPCHKKASDVVCEHPCEKMRRCRHPCQAECGQQCEAVECGLCTLQMQQGSI